MGIGSFPAAAMIDNCNSRPSQASHIALRRKGITFVLRRNSRLLYGGTAAATGETLGCDGRPMIHLLSGHHASGRVARQQARVC